MSKNAKTHIYTVLYHLIIIVFAFIMIYPLIWMTRIAEELKEKAISLGIKGPYTSWRHMFGWNIFGLFLMGPAIATWRFFDTLNKVEIELNINTILR